MITEKSFSIPRYLLYDKLKRRLYTNFYQNQVVGIY
jgi:hypothetical protein